MYADDAVIFYANKGPTVIENQLSKDMENVKNYCFTNEFIIITKKGKAEVMLFWYIKTSQIIWKETWNNFL